MNDIDTLMQRKQLIDAKDPGDVVPQDIDDLVTYFRYRRSRKVELDKHHDTGALDEIMPKSKPKTIPGIARRF